MTPKFHKLSRWVQSVSICCVNCIRRMTSAAKRVLIVDDHFVVRRGVRALLNKKPQFHVVGDAADGREAIQLVFALAPDIMILDYSMPRMNGLAVACFMRRHFPQTDIVMFTQHQEPPIVSQLVALGVKGYVTKAEPDQHLMIAVQALSEGLPYFSSKVASTLLDAALQGKPCRFNDPLTRRERQVLQLIAEGFLNREVAEFLHISMKTVESHRYSFMQKIQCRTTAELVRYAVKSHMIEA